MVIVLLAWIYVIMLFALAQNSMVAGFAVAFFFGFCPLSLLGWLLRRRRRMRIARLESRRKA
jgi:hypothetical protein